MTKWVYTFGDGKAEGGAKDKNLLGGKGANLAEMSALGLPVPPGFTITTEACTHYYANGSTYPGDLEAQVATLLAQMTGHTHTSGTIDAMGGTAVMPAQPEAPAQGTTGAAENWIYYGTPGVDEA